MHGVIIIIIISCKIRSSILCIILMLTSIFVYIHYCLPILWQLGKIQLDNQIHENISHVQINYFIFTLTKTWKCFSYFDSWLKNIRDNFHGYLIQLKVCHIWNFTQTNDQHIFSYFSCLISFDNSISNVFIIPCT